MNATVPYSLLIYRMESWLFYNTINEIFFLKGEDCLYGHEKRIIMFFDRQDAATGASKRGQRLWNIHVSAAATLTRRVSRRGGSDRPVIITSWQ